MRRLQLLLLVFAMCVSGGVCGWAWGPPHLAITRAAVGALPQADRELLGEESGPLADKYCLIPDDVFSDAANARYAMMDSRPGERYLTVLHLPGTAAEVEATLEYFVSKAVAAFREKRAGDGARFLGTICHLTEDYGSPSHAIPGDNQFTMLRQFLPPPKEWKHRLLHGPVESGTLEVDLGRYQPELLGSSNKEIAWRLMHRINESIVHSRGTTIPIIQALYAGDADSVKRHQLRAAEFNGRVVADALHSVLAIAGKGVAEIDRRARAPVGLGAFHPLEAPSLFYPQKVFFGAPYWGHPTHGYVLREGLHEEAFRLRMRGSGEERTFESGISVGGRSRLTYLLPDGVFAMFRAFVGLQAGLGREGMAEFTVEGDGKKIASVSVSGEDSATVLECAVQGVRELQLVSEGKRKNPKSNYAIWAEPQLFR